MREEYTIRCCLSNLRQDLGWAGRAQLKLRPTAERGATEVAPYDWFFIFPSIFAHASRRPTFQPPDYLFRADVQFRMSVIGMTASPAWLTRKRWLSGITANELP